jgi:hypothetical protein
MTQHIMLILMLSTQRNNSYSIVVYTVPACSMLLVMGIPQILIILWTVAQRMPNKCTFPPCLYSVTILCLPNERIMN